MAHLPLFNAPDQDGSPDRSMPLYREVAWDYEQDQPLWQHGEPVMCTGAAAVLVWINNCLRTERGSTDALSLDYGQDLRALVGKPYSAAVRQAEAIRSVQEALMINPYITAVHQISCTADGSTMHLHFIVDTIYGEVTYDDTL